MNKRAIGKTYEDIACAYLMDKNHTIVERNYRAGRIGEIDIITIRDQSICFIEVKGRSNIKFGTPAESVGINKQHKIRQVAAVYLQNTSYSYNAMHFIIVEILLNGNAYNVNLIEDAF